MPVINGLYPSALIAAGANNAPRLSLNDGSWYNLQVKYKNLALLPDLPIPQVSTAFGAVRANATQFDSYMTEAVLGAANDYYDFCQNLAGHLDSIATYRDCRDNFPFYRLAAIDAMDKIVADCQARLDQIAAAKTRLQTLSASSGSPEQQVGDLVGVYNQKLAQEDQTVLAMKSDLAAKWKIVFQDHEVFCEAFSSGILDAAMLVVDIGQAAGELASDETVSPDTVKEIIEKGVDLVTDTVHLFEAAAEAEKTLNEIHTLYPQLLQAMRLEYQDNRAAVLLDYAQSNYQETATGYADAMNVLTAEQNGWTSIMQAWSDWKSQLPADDGPAAQYLAAADLGDLGQRWTNFGQLAKSYAAVGNIVFQKVQQTA